jgi:hypothetical protein
VHVEIAEIERRAVLIYQAVWNHTGCLANDAIIVHGTSFPNSVVDPAYTRYARYVYGGAVDDFARAAYEGRISNDVFSAFVNEYLRKQISLDTFRDRYPGLV